MPDIAARIAVANASRVCRAVQQRLDEVRALTKDDRSPVTVADFASQAVVARILSERLGRGTRLVAEEDAAALREKGNEATLRAVTQAVRMVWEDATESDVLDAIDLGNHEPDGKPNPYWTLDPIDGTKGFIRGQQYCVSLARLDVVEGRRVVGLGVMGCPNLSIDPGASPELADRHGCMYTATRGHGATESPLEPHAERHPVNPLRRARGMGVRACESVESAHSDQSASARLLERLDTLPGDGAPWGGAAAPVRLDSQCKYAVVARAQADCYLRFPTRKGYVERIWDHAAGSLVATESGCVVSDVKGAALDYSHGKGLEKNLGVVVAPPELHADLIRAIGALGLDRAPE